MPVTSISLTKEDQKLLKQLKKTEKRQQSDIVRDALKQYVLSKRWEEIQKWGRQIALKYGLQTEDDVERFLG